MKWSGFCFLVPPPPLSSLHRLYFHGGPSVRGSHGWADMTLHLGLIHTSSSTPLWLWWRWWARNLQRERERHREIEWQRERVWSGIVEMSRPVRMHWFRITFLFHFTRRMLPCWENAILISRLRPNICTIQIGGYGGNVIQTWNMALSSYPAQPHWCFWAFHCSAKMKSFRVGAIDRLRKHILFCRTWQGLSCYLNNMSGAEVARKHYLWNIVWLNSGVKLQPTLTQQKPWTVEVTVVFHCSCDNNFSFFFLFIYYFAR